MEKITPEQFSERMAEIYIRFKSGDCDQERAHEYMDDLMCDVLNKLGYTDGVSIFVGTPKWYA